MTLYTPFKEKQLDIEIDNEFKHAAVFVGNKEQMRIIAIEDLMKILPEGFLEYTPT